MQRVESQKKGVAIVVGWVDEHGPHVIGLGRTRLEGGNEADGKTVFEIGSVSKVFTSLLLALAVEKGEVKLDDPVAKYLPPEAKVPSRGGRQITLLDLSTHHSGLPRMPDNFTPNDPEDPYADYTAAQMYAFLSHYVLKRDIGVEFEYSNFGAALLGQALARRAGKTYEQLVSERILQPLGMKSSGITLTPDEQARLAAPYKKDLSPAKNWNLGVFAGAGGIRSDVEDLLRFLSAEMGLTPSPLASTMQTTQQSHLGAGNGPANVGLGWLLEPSEGGTVVWHDGGTGGYRSYVAFDPAQRRGIVVLSNTENDVDDIGANLLHPPKPHTAVALQPEVADRYAGRYELAPDFVLTFSREGSRCYLQASGQGKNEVFPESDTDFFLTVVDAQISFVKGAGGEVTGLILHQHGDQAAKRLP